VRLSTTRPPFYLRRDARAGFPSHCIKQLANPLSESCFQRSSSTANRPCVRECILFGFAPFFQSQADRNLNCTLVVPARRRVSQHADRIHVPPAPTPHCASQMAHQQTNLGTMLKR
jgi:hypothetical protein